MQQCADYCASAAAEGEIADFAFFSKINFLQDSRTHLQQTIIVHLPF